MKGLGENVMGRKLWVIVWKGGVVWVWVRVKRESLSVILAECLGVVSLEKWGGMMFYL